MSFSLEIDLFVAEVFCEEISEDFTTHVDTCARMAQRHPIEERHYCCEGETRVDNDLADTVII